MFALHDVPWHGKGKDGRMSCWECVLDTFGLSLYLVI